MRDTSPDTRQFLSMLACVLAATLLAACAGMPGRDPVRLYVVALEPAESQGLEMRFNVKLRLQNPNDREIPYDGLALELELNGKEFATGVSSSKGSIPRFGEAVINVPVTVSALAAVRQALGIFRDAGLEDVPYAMRGKLGGGVLGEMRFAETGTISLPSILKIEP